jgi:hypothetical protein
MEEGWRCPGMARCRRASERFPCVTVFCCVHVLLVWLPIEFNEGKVSMCHVCCVHAICLKRSVVIKLKIITIHWEPYQL